MNNISLRQIRTFLAVLETGSFRKASEKVHLSQPAVTAHVQRLEDELGVPLLNRTTRRVTVTPAGERFSARAEHMISELNSVVLELQDEAALQRGRVVVACVPTIASRFLPQTMAEFRNQYPGITIEIHDIPASDILNELMREQSDIGIGPESENKLDFEFQLLARDPYVVIVRNDHPWARKKSISLRDLTQEPLLTMARGSNVRSTLEKAMFSQSLVLRPRIEAHHHYTLGGMVEAGLGITVLPSMAVSMLSQPLLQTIPIRRPSVFRNVSIIKLRGKTLTPAEVAFIQVLKEQIAAQKPHKIK